MDFLEEAFIPDDAGTVSTLSNNTGYQNNYDIKATLAMTCSLLVKLR